MYDFIPEVYKQQIFTSSFSEFFSTIDYRLDDFDSRQGQEISLFSKTSRQALRLTQLLIPRALVFFPTGKPART
jgi:hypothetical protein